LKIFFQKVAGLKNVCNFAAPNETKEFVFRGGKRFNKESSLNYWSNTK
jgi:hypothetical protein